MAATASTLSPYEVVSDAGLTLGKTFYRKGARLGLTPDQAFYLELSGSVRSLADLVLDPPPVYVPPVVGPITPTESNTLVQLTVSGLSTFVTVENLVNLFPKLRPARGLTGDRGEKGEVGPRGPSVVVNGHSGDSVVVTKSDVGLGAVENIAPQNMPVSTQQAQAIASAVAAVLDQIASGGDVDLSTLSTIVAGKASKAELASALTVALTQLVDGASGTANTLGKLETLVAAARAATTAVDTRVSGILSGSNAAVDTFIEVYNKFVADESAAAALTTVVGTKAAQTDLVALQGVVGTKASQADLVGLAVDTLDAVSGKLDKTVADQGAPVDAAAGAISGFYRGLGTASMPAPSGDPGSDVSRFSVQRAKGTRYIEHQDGIYQHDGSQITMGANQRLIGHGAGRTTWLLANQIPVGTSRQAMFLWLDAAGKDVGIDGVTVDAADFREPFPFWAPIVLRGSVGLRVRDVNAVRFPRFGAVINGGTGLTWEGGRLIRSTTPKDSTGAIIAAGQQAQGILVSESGGAAVNFRFEDIYSKGAGHDASGSYFDWIRCEIDGFNFGCGFVLEQNPTCHHHRFIDSVAHGGRGIDNNQTAAGGFELWGKFAHQVVRCRSYDNDGYALTLGAPGSIVRDCSWEDIGRVATAAGVGLSNGVSGTYSAVGSSLAGSRYIPAPGNESWSVAPPISWSTLSPALAVEITDTVPAFCPTAFPPTTLWNGNAARVTGHSAYSGSPSGPAQAPLGISAPGVIRGRHFIDTVSFVPDDGSVLASSLRAFAEVNADNSVVFWIGNTNGAADAITFKPGTFTGRIKSL